MAIEKEMKLSNGAVGNYWKIVSFRVDKIAMTVDYVLNLFVDKGHADIGAGLDYLKHFNFGVNKQDLSGDMVAFGYTHIKSYQPVNVLGVSVDIDFSDGADV